MPNILALSSPGLNPAAHGAGPGQYLLATDGWTVGSRRIPKRAGVVTDTSNM